MKITPDDLVVITLKKHVLRLRQLKRNPRVLLRLPVEAVVYGGQEKPRVLVHLIVTKGIHHQMEALLLLLLQVVGIAAAAQLVAKEVVMFLQMIGCTMAINIQNPPPIQTW